MPIQVAVRSGRRVVNPPWALFLNVVDIVSVGRFYNFMQPQRAQTNLFGTAPRSAPAPPRGAWRLRGSALVGGEAAPPGARPLPRVLERAASKVADRTVF